MPASCPLPPPPPPALPPSPSNLNFRSKILPGSAVVEQHPQVGTVVFARGLATEMADVYRPGQLTLSCYPSAWVWMPNASLIGPRRIDMHQPSQLGIKVHTNTVDQPPPPPPPREQVGGKESRCPLFSSRRPTDSSARSCHPYRHRPSPSTPPLTQPCPLLLYLLHDFPSAYDVALPVELVRLAGRAQAVHSDERNVRRDVVIVSLSVSVEILSPAS